MSRPFLSGGTIHISTFFCLCRALTWHKVTGWRGRGWEGELGGWHASLFTWRRSHTHSRTGRWTTRATGAGRKRWRHRECRRKTYLTAVSVQQSHRGHRARGCSPPETNTAVALTPTHWATHTAASTPQPNYSLTVWLSSCSCFDVRDVVSSLSIFQSRPDSSQRNCPACY